MRNNPIVPANFSQFNNSGERGFFLPFLAGLALTAPFWGGFGRCCGTYGYPRPYPIPTPFPAPYPLPTPYVGGFNAGGINPFPYGGFNYGSGPYPFGTYSPYYYYYRRPYVY